MASHFAFAECVVVEGSTSPEVLRSSDNLRLNIRREGKAAPGVAVTVLRQGVAVPYSVSVTDESGVVVLEGLPLGKYRIDALDQNGRGAWLDLEATPNRPRLVTSLNVSLGSGVSADVATGVANVRHFKGVVVDPSGARIPRAEIIILRSGDAGKPIQSSAASDGSFAIELAGGEYWAFVRKPNFRTEVVRFVISEQGTDSLSISLTIGGC